MPKLIDLTGQRFGRLVVLYMADERKNREVCWVCRCDCGNIVTVRRGELRKGKTTSCGCYNKERLSETHKTHGLSDDPLYHVYNKMVDRCYSSDNKRYASYGGRGVRVADEWLANKASFINYVRNVLGYKDGCGLTVDRINNDGNYEPGNCRLVTNEVQARNKQNSIMFEPGVHIYDKAEELGISKELVHGRLHRGWTQRQALGLDEPPSRKSQKKKQAA